MPRLPLLISVVVAIYGGSAAAGGSPQLPVSNLQDATGHASRLSSGVAYGASQFPIPLRVKPPDTTWSGAQWKTGRLVDGKGGGPFYGWAALLQGSPNQLPQGAIVIMTAYADTPSVAATVAGLRSRGHGATYEPSSTVKVAGFSGVQFDGRVVTKHLFVAFSPPSTGGGAYPGIRDAYEVAHNHPGGAFRVIVLNVRDKTVVVYLDSAALPPDQFPVFSNRASKMLTTLRFPG